MNSTDLIDRLVRFTFINGYYTVPIAGGVGLLTNFICLMIFLSPRFKDKNRFKFVILKVLIEMVGCLYAIGFQNYLQCLLEPHVLKTNKCVSSGTILFQIVRLYVYRYASYCFYVWSGINEIFVIYDRYLVLKNCHNLFNKEKMFKYITFLGGLFSFLFFVPNLFAYNIKQAGNTTSSFIIQRTSFGQTDFFQLYVLFVLTLSNIVSTVLLIISSAMLLVEFRKFRFSLSNLTMRSQSTARSRQEILRKKIEVKMIIMVFIMSLVFFVVRISDFVYTMNNSLLLLRWVNNAEFFVYFTNFWYIFSISTLNLNIFVLTKYNRKFRNAFFYYAKSRFSSGSSL